MVPYSLSPYGTGDIKTGSPTITITSGVGVLSVAQAGNIGVGCCIEFDSPTVYVYIAPNRLGFDSGGATELKVGDKIQGGTSGAKGIIRAIEVDSGSWAGGDAAGYLYFSSTSGTWQNNEQINRSKPTTSNNIATADGTLEGNIGNGNTQFVVKQADGTDAANTVGAETVNSIHHEYVSISAFEAGLTDSNHLNATNLTTTGATCYGCCYYDHYDYTADTTAFTVDNDGQDVDNYIHIFTPVGESESINNQRHLGNYNSQKFLLSVTYTGSGMNEEYTRFEGIQLIFNNATASARTAFVIGSNNISIYGNIFIGNATSTGGITGIYAYNGSFVGNKIYNNIIYDFKNTTPSAGYALYIRVNTTNYIYNNTIYNNYVAFSNPGGEALVFSNNLLNDNISNDVTGSALSSSSTHNVGNKTTSELAFGVQADSGNCDGIGADANKLRDTGQNFQTTVQVGCIVKNTTDTTYSYVTSVDSDTQLTLNDDIMDDGEDYIIYTNMYGTVTFKNEGGDDFHLAHNDTVAKNKGTDLSSDANLPIWNDIDRQGRG